MAKLQSGSNVYGNLTVQTFLTVTGNVIGGNVVTVGLVSATSNVTGGNILTAGIITATGNVTSGNILTAGIMSSTGNAIHGNITTAGLISATGNVTGGNLLTAGFVSATGNIVTGTNGFIGIGTSTPDTELTILANPQTISYPITGNSTTAGTDLHISGADGANTRITQDSFGTGSYVAFTGRTGRGTAAAPSQTLLNDTLAQFTARGFSNGSLQFGNASTGRVDIVAAENFTDTSRATNVQIYTTAAASITPTAVATFSSANGLSVTGNVAGSNVLTAGLMSSTGNAIHGNILTTGIVSATGNITGNYFIGNGSALTGLSGSSITNGTSNVTVVASGGNVSVGVGGTANIILATTTGSQTTSLGVGTAPSGTAGEIRATNNITAYYSSDSKFKENIQDIPDALDKVLAIGGKTFDWTDDYIAKHGGEDGYFVKKSDFGVIAQDVQAVFPQAVRTREDGTLAVDYEKLVALAFAAIVELKQNEKLVELAFAAIVELKQEIASLKGI